MRIARTALRTALIVAVFAILWPQLVALPFLRQNPFILESSILISRNMLAIQALCALAAGAAVIVLARANRPWRKLGLAVAACVVFSRVDIYELIFHPLQRPAFITASEVKLDGREKLLTINLKGHIRAYPVRSLSYHHIVNDVLEGVAVAATY